jgi:hypothetical protein
MHTTKKRDLFYCIAAIAAANFILFFITAEFIGGSAGGIVHGHYFLIEHGRSTEVSSVVYRYRQLHVYSLFVTVPLGIWALARARKLHKRVEDYNPVTSRNI